MTPLPSSSILPVDLELVTLEVLALVLLVELAPLGAAVDQLTRSVVQHFAFVRHRWLLSTYALDERHTHPTVGRDEIFPYFWCCPQEHE